MKKNYKIEVDCANCAQKMEDAANTVAGVASATVSFMTQKMKVEFAEGADPHDTMVNVLAACKKVEDDCEIELVRYSFEHPIKNYFMGFALIHQKFTSLSA